MRLRLLTLLTPMLLTLAHAQVIATVQGGAGVDSSGVNLNNASLGGSAGIAFAPVSHAIAFWNLLGLDYDRVDQHDGGAVSTSVEGWLTTSSDPRGNGFMVMAEAGAGRRWGGQFAGFYQWGAGAGWRLGDLIPYLEYRRRRSFHEGRPADNQLLIGLHFYLFG